MSASRDERGARRRRRWGLTPTRVEAVEAALDAGRFAVPRDATADDVAAELGIRESAFLERLRLAEGSLFAHLFG